MDGRVDTDGNRKKIYENDGDEVELQRRRHAPHDYTEDRCSGIDEYGTLEVSVIHHIAEPEGVADDRVVVEVEIFAELLLDGAFLALLG